MKTLTDKKVVSVVHFASKSSNSCEVIHQKAKSIILKPEKAFTIYSYFEDDPMVVAERNGENVTLHESTIVSIDYRNATIELKIISSEEFENNRKVSRYPVSLVGKINKIPIEYTAYIENISDGGVSFKTTAFLEVNSEIEIESNINGHYIDFIGTIVWAKEKLTVNEYGLVFKTTNPNINKIMKIIRKEHIKLFNK